MGFLGLIFLRVRRFGRAALAGNRFFDFMPFHQKFNLPVYRQVGEFTKKK